jgi:dipeptidyl aminopeptidase/acylaminoacyl peptidase
MVTRIGVAALAMLFPGMTEAAHATPAACRGRLLPPSLGAATGQRPLDARDLVELRDFGDSSVSPDGNWAALILRRADTRRDDYCMGVVLIALSPGGEHRLIDTGGELLMVRSDLRGVADVVNGSPLGNAPVWSPDGKSIAYLRRDHGIAQVWIASIHGRARQLTRLAEDARGVEWASASTVSVKLRHSVEARARVAEEGRSGYLYDRRFWAISEAPIV